MQVLRTEASGVLLEWIGYQEAAKLYYLGQVAYACGSSLFALRGGFNAKTGRTQSAARRRGGVSPRVQVLAVHQSVQGTQ